MKIDAAIFSGNPADAGPAAARLEQLGYAGGFTFEGPHDPFFPLAVAAQQTEHLELGTSIAIAFARSPMLLANIANDLQLLAKGRFILGLGSQIKPHIERRFSMPWSAPAARMSELVQAMRAIWSAWETGDRLDFRGEHYTHTLMTPMFNPGPNPHGWPPIFVAGVGPKMTEVAGEVADGFFMHPFNSPKFVQETTLPSLERGFGKAGKTRADFQVQAQLLVAIGDSDEEAEHSRAAVRNQLAFYGSTPAYKPVLDAEGRGDLQPELNRLSKQGQWAEMGALIDDSLLETLAVCGSTPEVSEGILARCAGVADRLTIMAPYQPDPARWIEVVKSLSA
jgi:probable F420-dependent oxidoreductase